MAFIKKLCSRYAMLISYSFWGIFAVAANMIGYRVCSELFGLNNAASTIVAWLLSVLTAFFTNKYFVFESKSTDVKGFFHEFCSFAGFRFLSGVVDLIIMIVAVDMMHRNPVVWKLIANIIVIAMNYVFSKFFIFKKQPELSHADS